MKITKIASSLLVMFFIITTQKNEPIYLYIGIVLLLVMIIINIVAVKKLYNNDGLLKERKYHFVRIGIMCALMVLFLYNRFFMQ